MKDKTTAALAAIIMFLTSMASPSMAQLVRKSTDALCLVPSATSLGLVMANKDKKGFFQLGFGSATCIAANYALERAITKSRPDGTGSHAFPSTHTAAAFCGATFLMRRYGWKAGVPAYLLACYVAWGRQYSRRHDWADVAGGAALGIGAAMIFTRPLHKKEKQRHKPDGEEDF